MRSMCGPPAFRSIAGQAWPRARLSRRVPPEWVQLLLDSLPVELGVDPKARLARRRTESRLRRWRAPLAVIGCNPTGFCRWRIWCPSAGPEARSAYDVSSNGRRVSLISSRRLSTRGAAEGLSSRPCVSVVRQGEELATIS